MMAFNPMLDGIVRELQRPVFTGEQTEYSKFKRDWEDYDRGMRVCSPQAISDQAALLAFRQCLPENLRLKLSDRMADLGNDMTMRLAWKMLDERYMDDSNAMERQKWVNLRLVRSGPDPRRALTLTDWENFEDAFTTLKRQVHDRTDEEEFRLVYAQLPTGMQNMVSQEIVRRGLNSL